MPSLGLKNSLLILKIQLLLYPMTDTSLTRFVHRLRILIMLKFSFMLVTTTSGMKVVSLLLSSRKKLTERKKKKSRNFRTLFRDSQLMLLNRNRLLQENVHLKKSNLMKSNHQAVSIHTLILDQNVKSVMKY